jgi:hypothetical protein
MLHCICFSYPDDVRLGTIDLLPEEMIVGWSVILSGVMYEIREAFPLQNPINDPERKVWVLRVDLNEF